MDVIVCLPYRLQVLDASVHQPKSGPFSPGVLLQGLLHGPDIIRGREEGRPLELAPMGWAGADPDTTGG
jgi:hypothetical protein